MNTLRTGDRTQLRVESLVAGGDGLARHNGLPVFVARTAPGDTVEVEIFDARKDFARGRVTKLIQPSNQRVEPLCKLFKVCGGCQWQHISYEEQLRYKQEIIRQAIKRNLPPDMVLPTIGAAESFFYRNKVQFPVKNPAGSKRLLAGYYEQDSHELVNIKHCPVQPAAFDEFLSQVKELAEVHGITAYNEHTQTGVLRHICIRGGTGGQLLLTLVMNLNPEQCTPPGDLQKKTSRTNESQQQNRTLAGLQTLARALKNSNLHLAGVCLNFNNQPGNRIYGEVTRVLEGQDFIEEHLMSHSIHAPAQLQEGLTFRVSATSFFQIHHQQTEKMLDVILEAVLSDTAKVQRGVQPQLQRALPAEEPPPACPIIIDAYAGVGTIALWLAFAATRVIAIEESPSAASDAAENIKLNNLTNIDFRHGKVEEILPQLRAQGIIKPGIIVLDPPRKGVSKKVIQHVLKLQPKRIIYISCNPATLARDLNELSGEYKTVSIQPIDMFPQTFHIESVSVLERAG